MSKRHCMQKRKPEHDQIRERYRMAKAKAQQARRVQPVIPFQSITLLNKLRAA